MSEPMAPEGMIWVCGACGKRSRGRYGTDGDKWWDESCSMNSVLVEVAALDGDLRQPFAVLHETKHTPPHRFTVALASTREVAETMLRVLHEANPDFNFSIVEQPEGPRP